ncbi:DUF1489 family protein [Parvularcula maris]|uniref:DUF1489 domain-containing protein n=1 Tax=Parvularcula maris TaxID=2965077 RepID=A0A9X2LA08_9PROT|nr:DUF1489 domain-containing protein [Parvularcula maris]MCQ8185711.1 DUF1489 domain-containing protein [Parvularcula maris]
MSVGTQSVANLGAWQQSYFGKKGPSHTTRMFPKRAEELKAGGSIYWVIQGSVQARQVIKDLVAVKTKSGTKCRIVLEPSLIPVRPVARKPFQGWRYLKPEEAPPDLDHEAAEDDLPIRAELAELGLL